MPFSAHKVLFWTSRMVRFVEMWGPRVNDLTPSSDVYRGLMVTEQRLVTYKLTADTWSIRNIGRRIRKLRHSQVDARKLSIPYANTLTLRSANRRVVISRRTKADVATLKHWFTLCVRLGLFALACFIPRMRLQDLVFLAIWSPFVSTVLSYTAVDSSSKYLYVPSSFCLGITEWYPTFLVHFEENQTTSDDGANVAAYVASYADCHVFGLEEFGTIFTVLFYNQRTI